MGLTKSPLPFPVGAGKGTPLMTEKLRFKQGLCLLALCHRSYSVYDRTDNSHAIHGWKCYEPTLSLCQHLQG